MYYLPVRRCHPRRFLFLIILLACLLHARQIYLESNLSSQKALKNKHFLFVSEERKYKRSHDIRPVFNTSDQRLKILEKKRPQQPCTKKRSVLFVKTHKTGSTTLTNIVLRYALKRQLIVGLPLPRHWQLGGYPARFKANLVLPRLLNYDVLCHHLRYDHKVLRSVLSYNTVAITVLRDPAQGFESGFAFFRDWPYPKWFKNVSEPENLQLFLDQPQKYYNSSTPWFFRAKNYMAFDLGFDHERNDLKYSKESINEMTERFDLVLITERLDESLILLKELLCMDSYDDIVYIRLKVRQGFARRDVTEKMKKQIREWNFLDSKLYEYFNKTLTRKIFAYGETKMKKALEEFRDVQEEMKEKCVESYDQYHRKPWISKINLKRNAGEFCEKISWGEVRFGDYVREMQRSYDVSEDAIQPSLNEMQLLFENAQIGVIGEEAARNSA